jgi:hypothetical protein
LVFPASASRMTLAAIDAVSTGVDEDEDDEADSVEAAAWMSDISSR